MASRAFDDPKALFRPAYNEKEPPIGGSIW
jgi:hypothetical protein